LSEKPDIIRYFEELMEKISCDYETRNYEFSGGPPGSGSCGLIYFAKDPDAVHKKLYKTIQKLKRCFKKLEDKMNKEHLLCPYCSEDYKKTKCMHYVTHTDVMNYPRLSEKLKDKKWLQENLRKTFGELHDVLDAYEHGLTKEPNRIVYLKKLLEKLSNCELKYYEHKESLVVFANDKEKIIEKLSEMEKRLFWLFRGIAYVEGIKVMGNTKGRK
jgi:DNA repair ATPase RecN